MDHPDENRFPAAVGRYRDTEEAVRVTAYLSTAADRDALPASISAPSMVTTIHGVEVMETGCIVIRHGRHEHIILLLRNDDGSLARDLADAWNVVLARHAAGAPAVGRAPEVRAA